MLRLDNHRAPALQKRAATQSVRRPAKNCARNSFAIALVDIACGTWREPRRLLARVLSHAMILIGTGIAAGNLVLLLFVATSDEVDVADVRNALLFTSSVIAVGLLACIEPARRALRIQPTDALKEA